MFQNQMDKKPEDEIEEGDYIMVDRVYLNRD